MIVLSHSVVGNTLELVQRRWTSPFHEYSTIDGVVSEQPSRYHTATSKTLDKPAEDGIRTHGFCLSVMDETWNHVYVWESNVLNH